MKIDQAKLRELVPEHLRSGLQLYIERGLPPGHFLTAVLENDLMEAMGRADEISRAGLFTLCQFLYCYAPRGCHGSRLKVYEWVKHSGLDGIERNNDA